MKKIVCIVVVMILIGQPLIGQKFQLTEAATEYKNNFSPAWMLQPDKLEQNKSTLQKAKKAIDECYNKQLETPFTKPKDEAKMYYYRGMIYLDYTMMAAMDVEIMSELKTADEKSIQDASIGSLKKCMELDSRGEWKDQIQAKVNMLRSTMINGGVEMFKQENYEAAHQAFSGAVEIYSVLSIPDTLAMVNAALAAERNKDYDNAKKYYQMCADNNYGNGAEMYVSMIRVLSAKGDSGSNDEVLKVIESGIKRFPNDYTLNVEEFNYWYSNGDNTKAQAALQKAIESDPNNHILHFNIGVVFDNMSGSAHKAKNHDDAFLFMDKSIESYKSAIEIKPDYGDAFFNLGALYYNQSIEVQSLAQDLNGEEYDKQVARADQMMKDALPFLEKSHEISPKDVSTLTVLKSIYMNLSMEDKYKETDTKLKALGQ
jgi:tetratricopeptide (TPR) repeat protein